MIVHLLFGNLLIGIFEGLLLAWLFHLHKGKSILVLIIANYFSTWVGGILIPLSIGFLGNWFNPNLYNALYLIAGFILINWVVTLILEFLFVFFLLKKETNHWKKSISGSLIIQSASYLLLVVWYGCCGNISLYTQNEIVSLDKMNLPKGVDIYFISAQDRNVYNGSLATQDWKKVYDLNSKSKFEDRLFVFPSETNTNYWDLCFVGRERNPDYSSKYYPLLKSFAQVAAPFRNLKEEKYISNYNELYSHTEARLGTATNSNWNFSTDFHGRLSGTNAVTGKKREVGMDSIIAFQMISETLLPGDILLFQLGGDQICLYDPEKRQVALLARGYSPIAVMAMDNSPTNTASIITTSK